MALPGGMARSGSGNRSSIQRLRQYNETTMAAQGPAPGPPGGPAPGLRCVPRPAAQGGAGGAGAADILRRSRGTRLVRAGAGALGRAREEIDAINVYPVADGDTGTNLYLTLESARRGGRGRLRRHVTGRHRRRPVPRRRRRAMAHGALIGARGNSGTILAQLLRGMAQVLAADGDGAHTDGGGLRLALRHAADAARQAVAHPVEGTVLTVASAAADAASAAGGDPARTVARAAYEGARAALAATPGQLAVLGRAGVVDAGRPRAGGRARGAGGDAHGGAARRRGAGDRAAPRGARSADASRRDARRTAAGARTAGPPSR